MSEYYTVLTHLGAQKVAAAIAGGPALELTDLVVGDGGGGHFYENHDREALKARSSLINQRWSGPLYLVDKDPQNPAWAITEGQVPVDVGGWYIREVGIKDSAGDLIAIGVYPETYKPVLAAQIGADLTLRSIIEVGDANTVTLKIDPSVVQATREWVDQHKVDKSQIGNAADQLPTNAISDQRYMSEGIPIQIASSLGRAASFKKIASEGDVNVFLLNPSNSNGNHVLQGTFYFGAAPSGSTLNRSSALLDIASHSSSIRNVAISGLLTAYSDSGLDEGGFRRSNAQVCLVRYQGTTWLALYVQNRSSDTRRDIFKGIAFSGVFANGALEWISDADLDIADGDAEPTITPILTRENNWQPTSGPRAFIGRPGDQIANNTAWHSGNTIVDAAGFIKGA